jgi:hypothetical protein
MNRATAAVRLKSAPTELATATSVLDRLWFEAVADNGADEDKEDSEPLGEDCCDDDGEDPGDDFGVPEAEAVDDADGTEPGDDDIPGGNELSASADVVGSDELFAGAVVAGGDDWVVSEGSGTVYLCQRSE